MSAWAGATGEDAGCLVPGEGTGLKGGLVTV